MGSVYKWGNWGMGCSKSKITHLVIVALGFELSESDSRAGVSTMMPYCLRLCKWLLGTGLHCNFLKKSSITDSVSLSLGTRGGMGWVTSLTFPTVLWSLTPHLPSSPRELQHCTLRCLSLKAEEVNTDWIFVFPWGKTCRFSIVQWKKRPLIYFNSVWILWTCLQKALTWQKIN